MRHLAVLFVCFFIFLSSAAYGAPVGNIASPSMLKSLLMKGEKSQFGIIGEAEVDITRDRDFKREAGDAEFNFYGGKAGIVVADRGFLYGIFGIGEAEQEFNISVNKVKWDTDTDTVWGAGATVVFYEKEIDLMRETTGVLRLGVDGRFRRAELDVEKVTLNNTAYDLPNASVTDTKFEFDEWQAALEVSLEVNRLVPYFGIKYSDIDGEAKTRISTIEYKYDLEPEDNFGIFAGIDVLIMDSVSVNAEGRFLDEIAFSAGASIRF